MVHTVYQSKVLNQAHAGQRPVHNWFLEITFVRNVSMHVCPPPRAVT